MISYQCVYAVYICGAITKKLIENWARKKNLFRRLLKPGPTLSRNKAIRQSLTVIIVGPEQGGDVESPREWMKLLIGSKSLQMIRGRHRALLPWYGIQWMVRVTKTINYLSPARVGPNRRDRSKEYSVLIRGTEKGKIAKWIKSINVSS